ncbi:MAG: hypothetical protein NVSMB68_10760 [Thermoanaerobaculia bacterium]
MTMADKSRTGRERRQKQRVQLTRGLIARLGAMPSVILDITDSGARIEHFSRLDVGRKARFRFGWMEKTIEVEAMVVACRLHRFAHGDDGATVYQSGLSFTEYIDDAAITLREFVTQHVARSLAEQVANARGIGPIIEKNMPVFREGVVATSGIEGSKETTKRMLPSAAVAVDRGYVRCSLSGNRWDKKWSRTPEQPEDGFTVLASEPPDHIDQLCESYLRSNAEDRQFIRLLARVSVERAQETPEPR